MLDVSKKDYNYTRKTKRVSFNKIKENEMLDFLKDKEFSTYIKKLIEKEMRK